jgi:hypothetical protein
MAWVRLFRLDPSAAADQAAQVRVSFLGRYLAGHLAMLESGQRQGSAGWVLWLLDARTGEPLDKRGLSNNILAHAVDEEQGVFYYVDAGGDQGQRALRSRAIDPAREGYRPLDVSLLPRFMPANAPSCALSAGAGYVGLAVPPSPPGIPDYAIWVFTAEGKEHRRIALPEGRTLPPNRALAPWLDTEGFLYVYNVPSEAAPAGGAPSRAYLTALRLAGDPADAPAWEGPAPVVNVQAGGSLLAERGTYVVLSAPRANPPGATSSEGGVAVVYDKGGEGYIRLVHSDLAAVPDAFGGLLSPVAGRRGRLFLCTVRGLQIYGN